MRDKERESYERKKSIKSPIGDLVDANRRVSFGKSEFYRADSVESQNSVTSEEYREAAAGFATEILNKSVENELYHEKSVEITENVLQKAYAENLEKFSRGMSPEKSRKTSRPSTAESRIQSASKATPIESEASELSLTNESRSREKSALQRRPESGKSDLQEIEEPDKHEDESHNQSVNKTNQAEAETVENPDSKAQSEAKSSKSPELSSTDIDPKVTEGATQDTDEMKDTSSEKTKKKVPKSPPKEQKKAQEPGFRL